MARAPRTTSRMEKFVSQASQQVPPAGTLEISHQLDGGEVEAQVKRIMLSAAESVGKLCTFKLGLFQFAPSAANFNEDEAIVISGAIGNQFAHNETITMRVPKDWYIGVQYINFDTSPRTVTHSLQLNYKVLNWGSEGMNGFNPDYRARVWQLIQALHLERARHAPSALRVSGTVPQRSPLYAAVTGTAPKSERDQRS